MDWLWNAAASVFPYLRSSNTSPSVTKATGYECRSKCWMFARSCKLDLLPDGIEMATHCVVVVRSDVCKRMGGAWRLDSDLTNLPGTNRRYCSVDFKIA